MDAMESRNCIACVGVCPGKGRWPELVGAKGSEAKEIIERENPHVEVRYIWCGWQRIMDCCCNRVWLFVDGEAGGDHGEGRVCNVPIVG